MDGWTDFYQHDANKASGRNFEVCTVYIQVHHVGKVSKGMMHVSSEINDTRICYNSVIMSDDTNRGFTWTWLLSIDGYCDFFLSLAVFFLSSFRGIIFRKIIRLDTPKEFLILKRRIKNIKIFIQEFL